MRDTQGFRGYSVNKLMDGPKAGRAASQGTGGQTTPEWKPRALFRPRGAFLLGNWVYRRVFSIDSNPEKTADWVGLKSGMEVLELGPGPGYYTSTIARRVAPGTVHAVDLQQEMLDHLARRTRASGVDNVRTYCADAGTLPFADNSMDLIWALYMLEEVPDLEAVAREMNRVLRPGGHVAIAQVAYDFSPDQKASMRSILPAQGFRLVWERDRRWIYRAKYVKD